MGKKKSEKSKKTQWVLVDTVSQFHMQYMIEVPVGEEAWALDVVTCEDAKEFGQKHIGETIVTHRIVTKEEALALCDKSNEYCKSWDDSKKIEAFFTNIEHYKK